ncbi:hypothetical protein [Streptomyces sp. NPDC005385]|uniref:hypothetical protein n=1 Tax=Streptomyces sp. NPDC005385 TaxID=3157039 RepID=UPI0033BC4BB9
MTAADYAKFLPGWLAFLWVIGNAAWKGLWVRHHRLALGAADDELREALTATRSALEDITSKGGRRANWFEDPERRETDRKLKDLAGRRKDRSLRAELEAIGVAWREAFGKAPPHRILASFAEAEPTLREIQQQAEDEARFLDQIESARAGLDHVEAALQRLNELEFRTHGRS